VNLSPKPLQALELGLRAHGPLVACRLPLAHPFGRRVSLKCELVPLLVYDQSDDQLPLDR
jgi:hypothetical protein